MPDPKLNEPGLLRRGYKSHIDDYDDYRTVPEPWPGAVSPLIIWLVVMFVAGLIRASLRYGAGW